MGQLIYTYRGERGSETVIHVVEEIHRWRTQSRLETMSHRRVTEQLVTFWLFVSHMRQAQMIMIIMIDNVVVWPNSVVVNNIFLGNV
jgi:hypothetical protein